MDWFNYFQVRGIWRIALEACSWPSWIWWGRRKCTSRTPTSTPEPGTRPGSPSSLPCPSTRAPWQIGKAAGSLEWLADSGWVLTVTTWRSTWASTSPTSAATSSTRSCSTRTSQPSTATIAPRTTTRRPCSRAAAAAGTNYRPSRLPVPLRRWPSSIRSVMHEYLNHFNKHISIFKSLEAFKSFIFCETLLIQNE